MSSKLCLTAKKFTFVEAQMLVLFCLYFIWSWDFSTDKVNAQWIESSTVRRDRKRC